MRSGPLNATSRIPSPNRSNGYIGVSVSYFAYCIVDSQDGLRLEFLGANMERTRRAGKQNSQARRIETEDEEYVALDFSFPATGHNTSMPLFLVLHGLNGDRCFIDVFVQIFNYNALPIIIISY